MNKLPPEYQQYYEQKMTSFRQNLPDKENKAQDRIAQITESNERIYMDSIAKLQWNNQKESEIANELETIRKNIENVKNDLLKSDNQEIDDFEQKYYIGQQNKKSHKKLINGQKGFLSEELNTINSSARNVSSTYRTGQASYNQMIKDTLQFVSSQVRDNKIQMNYRQTFVEKPYGQSDLYLLCHFSRINKSTYLQQIGKNRIKMKNKSGETIKEKLFTFKNEIISSQKHYREIFQQCNGNFLYIGAKSTGKQEMMRIQLKSLINYSEQARQPDENLKFILTYIIHGVNLNSKQNMFFDQHQMIYQIQYINDRQLEEFWQYTKSDAYYNVKKLINEQMKIYQRGDMRKQLHLWVTNDLKCLKILKLEVQSNLTQSQTHWLIISNNLPSNSNNWLVEVFLLDTKWQPILNGIGNNLQIEGLNAIRKENKIRKIIWSINPLKYKQNESLKTLEFLDQLKI